MKIELLYFDGCPSWKTGLKNLQSALEEEGLIANEQAGQLKFLGSPSFRVDSQELWPEERETYALSCRVFPSSEGIKGFPTVAMLRGQLKQLRET